MNMGMMMMMKETKMILKYKDLPIEIQCMLDINTQVIPVITGAMKPSQNNSDNT